PAHRQTSSTPPSSSLPPSTRSSKPWAPTPPPPAPDRKAAAASRLPLRSQISARSAPAHRAAAARSVSAAASRRSRSRNGACKSATAMHLIPANPATANCSPSPTAGASRAPRSRAHSGDRVERGAGDNRRARRGAAALQGAGVCPAGVRDGGDDFLGLAVAAEVVEDLDGHADLLLEERGRVVDGPGVGVVHLVGARGVGGGVPALHAADAVVA